jgi:hypothetical protein
MKIKRIRVPVVTAGRIARRTAWTADGSCFIFWSRAEAEFYFRCS